MECLGAIVVSNDSAERPPIARILAGESIGGPEIKRARRPRRRPDQPAQRMAARKTKSAPLTPRLGLPAVNHPELPPPVRRGLKGTGDTQMAATWISATRLSNPRC
jgi:hypothetical protein